MEGIACSPHFQVVQLCERAIDVIMVLDLSQQILAGHRCYVFILLMYLLSPMPHSYVSS